MKIDTQEKKTDSNRRTQDQLIQRTKGKIFHENLTFVDRPSGVDATASRVGARDAATRPEKLWKN